MKVSKEELKRQEGNKSKGQKTGTNTRKGIKASGTSGHTGGSHSSRSSESGRSTTSQHKGSNK